MHLILCGELSIISIAVLAGCKMIAFLRLLVEKAPPHSNIVGVFESVSSVLFATVAMNRQGKNQHSDLGCPKQDQNTRIA